MKVKTGSKGVPERLLQAEKEKDWGLISDMLYNASEKDAKLLVPIIPKLIIHYKWLVRASAVEFVGDFNLTQFVDLVKKRLEDRNTNVRIYALMAYYDLLGAKSLPLINKFCRDKNIRIRVTALALHYVETYDKDSFEAVSKIVLRKNCYHLHRSAVLNIFDHYLDIPGYAELLQLFRNIIKAAPQWQGVTKDIKSKLAEWGS